jgi:NADPH2:quinone reductase
MPPTVARAARLAAHGEPLRLEEVVLPDPAPDEVVVTLAYAGVNPVDRYIAEGRVAPDGPLPRTIGTEAAGRVGGRAVVVRGHGLGTTRDGLWASAAVVPETSVIDVPDGVDLRVAAAAGVAGVTAWRTVTELARVTAEDRVLVLGASGGVGSIVTTLTSRLGARTWGQTGREENREWIRGLGAEDAVACDASTLVDAVAGLAPTVVFDPLGGGYTGAAVEALASRGRLVLFGTSAGPTGELPLQRLYRNGLTVFGYGGLTEPEERITAGIVATLAALRDGQLQIPIDRVLPLVDANEAFDLLARRSVRGKLVLDNAD